MPGAPKRVSLRGLMRPPPLPLAGGAGLWDDCPAEEEDDEADEGMEGGASWEGIDGWDPPPRSWMGEAVVVDERSAEVESSRLSAREGSDRRRG